MLKLPRTLFSPPEVRQKYYPKRIKLLLERSFQFPITIVHGGPGYGKTSFAACFFDGLKTPRYWLQAVKRDRDFHAILQEFQASFFWGRPGRELTLDPQESWQTGANRILNEIWEWDEGFLVMDDLEQLSNGAGQESSDFLEHFLAHLPPSLHCLLIGRRIPALKSLGKYRLQGNLLTISHEDLALTESEFKEYARESGVSPSTINLPEMYGKTRGWMLATSAIFRSGKGEHFTGEEIFEEVYGSHTPELRSFLVATSFLEEIDQEGAEACAGSEASNLLLHLPGLLFVERQGGRFTYHPLFKEFLRKKGVKRKREQQRKVATFLKSKGRIEEAISLFLAASEFSKAKELLLEHGEAFLSQGRFHLILSWLGRLPHLEPELLLLSGEAKRVGSSFEEALNDFSSAEREARKERRHDLLFRVLMGKAKIYVDTVQPLKAQMHLKELLKMAKKPDSALKALVAENKVNEGKAEIASIIYRGEEAPWALQARILLRSGKIQEAISFLASVREGEQAPHFHRERLLLISFLYALRGEMDEARVAAEKGLSLARKKESPFTEAVAHMRLGHAMQLEAPEKSEASYRKALELLGPLEIQRPKAEAYLGLSFLYASLGRRGEAEACADEGLMTIKDSGDRWLEAYLLLAKRASQASVSRESFEKVTRQFQLCGDSFGLSLSLMWQYDAPGLRQKDKRDLLERLLETMEKSSCSFLLERPTLFGVRDGDRLMRMLGEALKRKSVPYFLGEALKRNRRGDLKVFLLGNFRLLRGEEKIPRKEWKREKALKLFQILLLQKGKSFPKEELMEFLSPDAPFEAQDRDFRVALHAVNAVLEPFRLSHEMPAYIEKTGTLYGMREDATLWVDAWEFEAFYKVGKRLREESSFLKALALYQGDLLEEYPYEDLFAARREYLRGLYVEMLQTVATWRMVKQEYESAEKFLREILEKDPYREEVYRLLMECAARRGDRGLLRKIFGECKEKLQELGLSPSPQTLSTYGELQGQQPSSSRDYRPG